MVDMHHKLMTRIYNHAQEGVDRQTRKQRRMIRSSLSTLHMLGQVILDEAVQDGSLRRELFSKVDKEKLIFLSGYFRTILGDTLITSPRVTVGECTYYE